MVIVMVFLLGIGNFALHRAVLESRHPLVERLTGNGRPLFGRMSMAAEFVALLTALLLVANGHEWWSWAYLGYSLFNAVSGWLILTRRI